MGDSHKRRHDSDDEEDFVGFDDSEGESRIVLKRVRNSAAGVEKEEEPIIYDLQSEEEFINLYQNWDSVDKSIFPLPGALGLPFEYGWKRELVFRATTGISKEKGDVYYITPNGRKLRTRNEIQSHLTPGLTMDNFSLSKVPLYLGPDYEIVRSAKLKTVVKVPSPRIVSPVLGKRIPKPKAPKGASPTPMMSTPGRSGGSSISPAGGGAVHSKVATPKPSTTPLQIINKSLFGTSSGPAAAGTPSTPIGNKRISLLQSQQVKTSPCTIQCRLAQGMVPQLQCVKCLCLYHKECVRANTSGQNYVCDGCCPPPKMTSTATTGHHPSTTSTTTTASNNNNRAATESSNSNAVDGGSGTGCSPPGRQSVVTIKGRRYIVVPNPKTIIPNTGTTAQQPAAATPQTVRTTPKVVPSPQKKSGTTLNGGRSSAVKGSSSSGAGVKGSAQSSSNFFRTAAMGYDVLHNVFQCLTIKELLRASRVCRLFNYTANHPALWRTIRMKNSQVNDWTGFTRTMRANGTRHLDMRKMLTGGNPDRMWEQFVEHIGTMELLQGIDLCGRCPPAVVEALFSSNRQLRVLNGQSLRDADGLNLADIKYLTELVELRLRPENWMKLRGDLKPVGMLTNLKHLSLTFFLGLTEESKHVSSLGDLSNLETLEIGECTKMSAELAQEVLPKLTKLRRLRLEKGVTDKALMAQLARMPHLKHVEFINFDVKAEFNESLGKCTNLRKLMIIPTYISQSATTNHLILSGLLKLAATLKTFTWVVTQELLRVAELYRVKGESIPIIKPVPGQLVSMKVDDDEAIPEVDMVPLTSVQEILDVHLPETFVTILKEDLNSTWRLNIVEP